MSRFTLLVVEDEPVVVAAARKALRPEGFEVEAAENPEAAREALERRRYHCVLLDLMLPGVAGMELVVELVGHRSAPPVIVTTGYVTARKCVEAFAAGAFDFLPKPFDVDELLGVVRRAATYGQLAPETGPPAFPAGAGRLYSLGLRSWARLEEDGLATLGLVPAAPECVVEGARVRLPESGSEIRQGRALARIEGPGSSVLQVWAPLSGRVVAGNPRLEARPELIQEEPFAAGWLMRISPSMLEEELSELTRR